MLKKGLNFLINVASSKKASISEFTWIYSRSAISATSFNVLASSAVFVKYDDTRFFRFFAFPT